MSRPLPGSPAGGAGHGEALRVSVEPSGRRHVIALEGELDLAAAPLMVDAFEAVLPQANAVVLDLDRVSFMDSSGLAAVLACDGECRRHGVGFGLTEGSEQVKKLFRLAGVVERLPFVVHLRTPD
jgi:anti-anti-sigma factor